MTGSQIEELLSLLRSLDARLAKLVEVLDPFVDTLSKLKPPPGDRWFPAIPSIYHQEDHQNERPLRHIRSPKDIR